MERWENVNRLNRRFCGCAGRYWHETRRSRIERNGHATYFILYTLHRTRCNVMAGYRFIDIGICKWRQPLHLLSIVEGPISQTLVYSWSRWKARYSRNSTYVSNYKSCEALFHERKSTDAVFSRDMRFPSKFSDEGISCHGLNQIKKCFLWHHIYFCWSSGFLTSHERVR